MGTSLLLDGKVDFNCPLCLGGMGHHCGPAPSLTPHTPQAKVTVSFLVTWGSVVGPQHDAVTTCHHPCLYALNVGPGSFSSHRTLSPRLPMARRSPLEGTGHEAPPKGGRMSPESSSLARLHRTACTEHLLHVNAVRLWGHSIEWKEHRGHGPERDGH